MFQCPTYFAQPSHAILLYDGLQTFPGKSISQKDVSRYGAVTKWTFPGLRQWLQVQRSVTSMGSLYLCYYAEQLSIITSMLFLLATYSGTDYL